MESIAEPLKSEAAGGATIAAPMVALDFGRRVTGWGMAIPVTSPVAWIGGASLAKDGRPGVENVVPLEINAFGVHRYPFRERDA